MAASPFLVQYDYSRYKATRPFHGARAVIVQSKGIWPIYLFVTEQGVMLRQIAQRSIDHPGKLYGYAPYIPTKAEVEETFLPLVDKLQWTLSVDDERAIASHRHRIGDWGIAFTLTRNIIFRVSNPDMVGQIRQWYEAHRVRNEDPIMHLAQIDDARGIYRAYFNDGAARMSSFNKAIGAVTQITGSSVDENLHYLYGFQHYINANDTDLLFKRAYSGGVTNSQGELLTADGFHQSESRYVCAACGGETHFQRQDDGAYEMVHVRTKKKTCGNRIQAARQSNPAPGMLIDPTSGLIKPAFGPLPTAWANLDNDD